MTPKFGQKLHQIDLEIYISFIEAKSSSNCCFLALYLVWGKKFPARPPKG